MNTILYQGVAGSYSHITAKNIFGENAEYMGLEKFQDVFSSLQSGKASTAVLPLENSLIGTIYEVFDLLHHANVYISGEEYTRISHCLLGRHGPHGPIEQIKKVLSHPKALEQCSSFFEAHPWIKPIQHYDTAAAAQALSLLDDPECAAIASEEAAHLYELDILKRDIQDDPNNYTRFGIITVNPSKAPTANKCSLLFKLEHVPGALAQVLLLFANENMNVTKIESRPIPTQPFEYLFYVDVAFQNRFHLEDLLWELQELVPMIKILGCYHGCHKKNP